MSVHPFEQYVNPAVGKLLSTLKLDKRYVRASGCDLYDENNTKYLDMLAGYGTLPFGFNSKELWSAIHELETSQEPIFIIPSMLEGAGQLAKKLIAMCCPGHFRYVTFANSGTEACEAALKLVRSATNRTGILSTQNGFHGKTLGSLSATGKPQYQYRFGAPVPGFEFVPFGDLLALENAFKSKVDDQYAAFILEVVQGEGGVFVAPYGYLTGVRQLCDSYGVMLIIDEVQTGLGRTGTFLACQSTQESILPDILLLAKALGGGLVPIGAVLYNDKSYNEYYAYKHSSTFSGNNLSARVGIRVLEMMERNDYEIVKRVESLGDHMLKRLRDVQAKYPHIIKEVRGKGFLIGIEFTYPKCVYKPNSHLFSSIAASQELMAGVISSYLLNIHHIRCAVTLSSSNTLRIEPPLIATIEMCNYMIDSLESTLQFIETKGSISLFLHLVSQHTPLLESKPRFEFQEKEEKVKKAVIIFSNKESDWSIWDDSLISLNEEQLIDLNERFGYLLEPFVFGIEEETVYIAIPRTNQYVQLNDPKEESDDFQNAIELARSYEVDTIYIKTLQSISHPHHLSSAILSKLNHAHCNFKIIN